MNQALQQYREFLELMGHRVIQTTACLWIDVRPFVFQPAPSFNFSLIDEEDVRQVMSNANAVACRWFSANDQDLKGSDTVLYAARPPYGMSDLRPRARTQTRRGLERVRIDKIELDEERARLAYPVYADNIRRLGLLKGGSRLDRRWRLWVNAIRKAHCVQFWGAWDDAKLVAFSVTVETPWGTELVMQRSSNDALPLFPNNALIYTIINDAFDRGSQVVSFGLSAFNGEKEGLHRFKVHMGFEAISLKESCMWHPLVRPFGALLKPQHLRHASQLVTRIRDSWMLKVEN